MTGHTPGPWIVEETDDGEHEIRMGSALESRAQWAVQHRIVYDHGLWDDPDATDVERAQYAEACANARLIAAAPDLLEACRLAMNDMEEMAYSVVTLSAVRAAWEKATGEAMP